MLCNQVLAFMCDAINKTCICPVKGGQCWVITCALQIYSTAAGTSKQHITALRTLRGLNLKNLSVFSLIQPNFSIAGSFCKTKIGQRFILKLRFSVQLVSKLNKTYYLEVMFS